jgi:hypothetical protein
LSLTSVSEVTHPLVAPDSIIRAATNQVLAIVPLSIL